MIILTLNLGLGHGQFSSIVFPLRGHMSVLLHHRFQDTIGIENVK